MSFKFHEKMLNMLVEDIGSHTLTEIASTCASELASDMYGATPNALNCLNEALRIIAGTAKPNLFFDDKSFRRSEMLRSALYEANCIFYQNTVSSRSSYCMAYLLMGVQSKMDDKYYLNKSVMEYIMAKNGEQDYNNNLIPATIKLYVDKALSPDEFKLYNLLYY